ncbi:hypothetical protein SAMN04487969_113172 [Paenibacillus algorifonticola]|uniref:Transcriptional regulator, TetR family n=1 Tax=Paenibacillus algorifonticola TaxID=684063 RepID=A0A1I2FWY5_9BACL|nr:hypothetical protein [Paenibacillus algorifonticola]SFF09317.1 hypothetical protein SAMN04487969_113172 [Paenibacillus algorifonticola]
MNKMRSFRGETKQLIMEKAGIMFMYRGYHAVSMNEIYILENMSKGSNRNPIVDNA